MLLMHLAISESVVQGRLRGIQRHRKAVDSTAQRLQLPGSTRMQPSAMKSIRQRPASQQQSREPGHARQLRLQHTVV